MSRASLPAPLLITLLLACWVSSTSLWAQEVDPGADQQPAPVSAQERDYRDAIARVESSQGAYAAQLPEQLLSLGLTLQSQGRHAEAIDLFKRGAHLARINDGLYSSQQVPMLQGQIASYVAGGDYVQADERQHYMYRVQIRSWLLENAVGLYTDSSISRFNFFRVDSQHRFEIVIRDFVAGIVVRVCIAMCYEQAIQELEEVARHS